MPNYYTGGVTDFSDQLRPTVGVQQKPGGFMSFLQDPTIRATLLHTGLGLLAQKDERGSLGGALGRALPYGLEAGKQAAREAAYQDLVAGAPPEMQAALGLLTADQGAALLAQRMLQPRRTTTLSEGATLVDETTGEVLAENEAPEEFDRQPLADGTIGIFDQAGNLLRTEGPAKDTSAEDAARAFNEENALADDFYRETAADREIAASVATVRSATDSPLGDQTRIIVLNKLLDPTSVVRTEEFDRVARAGGFPTMVQAYVNKMKDGRLPEDVRRQLDAEIASMLNARMSAFEQTYDRFRFRAEARGLNPDNITQDYYEPLGTGPVNVDLRAKYGLR